MTVGLKERPILFKGERVRAILAGRKTQTRRLRGLKEINQDPDRWTYHGLNADGQFSLFDVRAAIAGQEQCPKIVKCPYGQAGDGLYVRETMRFGPNFRVLFYEATNTHVSHAVFDMVCERKHIKPCLPSMFMPRWASRIDLGIVSTRLERLQEITGMDALAEGVAETFRLVTGGPIKEFRNLWDSINKKSGNGWDHNPWVWVITFELLEGARRAHQD